jgi:two-component system phosphate regulon sensor histidine kinase PhoR
VELWLPLGLAIVALGLGTLWRREVRARRAIALQARLELQSLKAQLLDVTGELARVGPALAASGEILLAVDSELRLRFASPAAVGRFGEPAGLVSLVGYSQNLELEQLARDALDTESLDGLERTIRIEDRPFRARAVRVGREVGLALTDEAELQRLTRARQDFIANLSHELNTPLTSLRLLVDTLISKAGKDRQLADELANKMVVEVDALHLMTQEMLELAAIESGQQVVRLMTVPLLELAEETVERLRDRTERKGLMVEVSIDPELKVLADREQATRALLNVLNNAVKFTPTGGRIELGGRHASPEDLVVLTVADTGPGIPPEELGRIFERFYRVRGSAPSPGTGLGLAIAHHILRAHAGRIWAENRPAPEKGAVFHLAFQAA